MASFSPDWRGGFSLAYNWAGHAFNWLWSSSSFIGQLLPSGTTSLVSWLCVSLLGGVGTAVYAIITDTLGIVQAFSSFCDSATPLFASLRNYLSQNPFWDLLSYMLALDVLTADLTSIVTVAVSVFVLSSVGLIFSAISATIPFFIYKAVRSSVKASTGGVVDP